MYYRKFNTEMLHSTQSDNISAKTPNHSRQNPAGAVLTEYNDSGILLSREYSISVRNLTRVHSTISRHHRINDKSTIGDVVRQPNLIHLWIINGEESLWELTIK